jgi:hypothetical protein
MYKNSVLIVNKCIKYIKPSLVKNKKTTIDQQKKFIRDKLDNILSPATNEYLKLEKELQKELKSMNNKTLKHKTR